MMEVVVNRLAESVNCWKAGSIRLMWTFRLVAGARSNVLMVNDVLTDSLETGSFQKMDIDRRSCAFD